MGKYGNRWKVIKSVGEGGQGKVFKVRDKNSGSIDWVLKELKNNKRLNRFEREIKALQVLDSPYIPHIEDYSINNEPFFIVFPDLGKDLKKLQPQILYQ